MYGSAEHAHPPILPHLLMIDAVLNTIRQYSMISHGDKVVVAVSGGPDSVALLHALWTLRDELGITLHVAHLDHSFRGEASDQDAEYVRDFAESLGIPAAIEKVDVPKVQRALRLSPEEAARLVRHDFLNRVADEVNASRIALGHTADDQVETVLMRILRGTGVDGLRGMSPVWERLIRPLIGIRRAEVEAYVRKHDLHPRTDETNLLPIYTRNRIRLELLPLLRREYNPGIDRAILQLAELAQDDVCYLDSEVQDEFDVALISFEEGRISLLASEVRKLFTPLARRFVRLVLREIRGDLANVGLKHVDEFLSILRSSDSFRYEFPGGVFAERSGNTLTFLSQRPPDEPIPYRYEVSMPGIASVPEAEVVVRAETHEGWLDPVRPPGSMDAVFDLDSIVGTLVVRSWQAGDRIRPLGMRGSKKLQDVFVDQRIPRIARCRIPVVADDVKVIWVPGIAVSDESRVTEATTRFLLLAVQFA